MTVFGAGRGRVRFARIACLLLATLGWVNVAVLGRAMLSRNPPAAGFDLELLLEAARRVADGRSPYDPSAVAGGLEARDLFYSYPPVVAQALVPLSGLPSWVVLSLWIAGAALGLGVVAALLPRAAIGRPRTAIRDLGLDTVLLTAAVAPFFFPFTVAMLFGNVDAWFPFLLGLVVVAVGGAGAASPARARVAAGVSLAVAAAVKIHPATLVAWLLCRLRRPLRAQVSLLGLLATTFAAGLGILVVSLALGGPGPWRDYFDYMRFGSEADLASRVNIGPASQIALLLGSSDLARPAALVVGVAAVALAVLAALRVGDPLESVAWAILASMVVLPVTWYHYPVALIPIALAAWTRSRGAGAARQITLWLLAAVLVADAAILLPVASWLAIGCLFVAVRLSRQSLPGDPWNPARPLAVAGLPVGAVAGPTSGGRPRYNRLRPGRASRPLDGADENTAGES